MKTEIGSDQNRACDWLNQGQLVAIPTETVYGLAANALNDQTVAKIFAAKERPHFDPLIVHLAPKSLDWRNGRFTDLSQFSSVALARLDLLAEKFWPGPLTLVLPKTSLIPDLVTSGLPRVALRKPSHSIAQALLDRLDFPLAAPSANRFGRISPTTAIAAFEELDGRIPYVLDGGPCSVGIESTVLLVEAEGTLTLLRPGGITREAIEAVTHSPVQSAHTSAQAAHSPGTLASHYAPRKPVFLIDPFSNRPLNPALLGKKIAILMLTQELKNQIPKELIAPLSVVKELVLNQQNDWVEVARKLFSGLRELDATDADAIISALPREPWEGLQFAVSDRLQRAAAPRSTDANA